MAFNKAREERKWKQWKEQEERILRESGMSEEVILSLHQMDWEDFKEERRYREHLVADRRDLEEKTFQESGSVVVNIQQLLDNIENEQILHTLLTADKKTLQILLMRIWGFSVKEISSCTGMPEQTIYTKINRLRKKIKKFLQNE